jgi:hypothetical protein
MTPTPIQEQLNRDFAALFGPSQPPITLPPEPKDETPSRGPYANL